jgi:hypothetical protein
VAVADAAIGVTINVTPENRGNVAVSKAVNVAIATKVGATLTNSGATAITIAPSAVNLAENPGLAISKLNLTMSPSANRCQSPKCHHYPSASRPPNHRR